MTEQIDNRILWKGSWTAFLIGAPIGLFVIVMTILTPACLTGEGLFLMAYLPMNGNAILGLTISFLISLFIAGRISAIDILKNKKLLFVSAKFSLTINLIIWPIFIIVFAIENRHNYNLQFGLLLPIAFAIISVIITPFTVGFLICYIIKTRIIK